MTSTHDVRPLPAWRKALHQAIQTLAAPPVGSVSEIEEDRNARDGASISWACHECRDTGAAVVITTRAVPDPSHRPSADERQRFVWCRAVYPGALSDLLDAIDAGDLTLTWTRHHI